MISNIISYNSYCIFIQDSLHCCQNLIKSKTEHFYQRIDHIYLAYSQINTNESNTIIHISDIEKEIKIFADDIKLYMTTSFMKLVNKIIFLNFMLPQAFNAGNIADIVNLFSNLTNFQNNKKKINNEFDEPSKCIIDEIVYNDIIFNQNVDLIINFIRLLKYHQFQSYSIFNALVKLFQKIYFDEKNSEFQSKIETSSFKELLIEEDGKTIFVFNQETNQKVRTPNEVIIQTLSTIRDQIQQKIEEFFKKETTTETSQNLCDIKKYFKTEISKFPNQVSKIIDQFKDKQVNTKELLLTLEELSPKLYDFPQEIDEKSIHLLNLNEYIKNMLLLAHYNIPQKYTFDLVIQKFIKYLGVNQEQIFINKSLEMFNKFVPKLTKGKNLDKFNDMFINLQLNSKYDEKEQIILLLIECFLDPGLFIPKIQNMIQDAFSSGNLEIRYSPHFMHNFASMKLLIDNNFNFYHQKQFNDDFYFPIDIERERKLFSKDISKFIVFTGSNELKIKMPYFPLGTFDHKEILDFSFVDKIVIILEIATALKNLHSANEYHGNLSSQFISLSSGKDAYLSGFCYPREKEKHDSFVKDAFYYHSPEVINPGSVQNEDKNIESSSNIKDPSELNESEEIIKSEQKNDIFSFGVLIHEIITDTLPKSRMKKLSRLKKIETLNGDYCEFLFKERDSIIFDNDLAQGIKGIIKKCMMINPEERYKSFEELIESIQLLPIYEQNKEYIEYRLEHAVASKNYKCSISDVVKSFFLNQKECLHDVEKVLFEYHKFLTQSEIEIEVGNDILGKIFEVFDFKIEDFSVNFHGNFNRIIYNYFVDKFGQKYFLSDLYHPIRQILNKEEINEKNIDSIVPLCTLCDFIKNNQNYFEENSLMWLCYICKEYIMLHSINCFFGEIKTTEIGLYYCNNTKTLLPSFILFNLFNNNTHNFQHSLIDEEIDKLQKNDIKNFIKFAKSFGISEKIYNEIKSKISMNCIFFKLFNYLLVDQDKQRFQIFMRSNQLSYLSFQITYSSLNYTFDLIKEKYKINELFIDFQSVFQTIGMHLQNYKTDPNNPIIEENKETEIKPNQEQNFNEVNNQREYINNRCCYLYQINAEQLH